MASKDNVLSCLRAFPNGTSSGKDDLRAQHLVDILGGASFLEILNSITRVVNLWLSGRCPVCLGEFVASAPLTPLLKQDGGFHPIAVGMVWRRLVSNVVMSGEGYGFLFA